jgi:hypothetical protein
MNQFNILMQQEELEEQQAIKCKFLPRFFQKSVN